MRILQQFNLYVDEALAGRSDLREGLAAKIDGASFADESFVRTAVVDAHDDRLAVVEVGHFDQLIKRHVPHRRSQGLVVEDFVIGRVFVDARRLARIPRRLAELDGSHLQRKFRGRRLDSGVELAVREHPAHERD